MKEKLIEAYMKTAKIFADCSTAVRLKVGAIVVKDNRIISIGYNGTPAGWDNVCEDRIYPDELLGDYEQHPDEFDVIFPHTDETGKRYKLKTKQEVMHAERNALDKLARGHENGEGAYMFITHAPCLECAKSIYGSGIKEVYYNTEYRTVEGLKFLEKCGIKVNKI
jgi:dCMP deaminase